MHIRFLFVIFLSNFALINGLAQNKNNFEFDGQVSVLSAYSNNNPLSSFMGIRYIPEINFKYQIDSVRSIDIETSVNFNSSVSFNPFDSSEWRTNASPYRIWMRYNTQQMELRFGLQKIDFGSASILRPLQWFNQIDPRDPLQLTNGVYGLLGRYYFINNSNIWLWTLYGNKKVRGFDSIESNKNIPEFGGRIQIPVKKGEIAFSYHHRTANSGSLVYLPSFSKIPENKFAVDAKFDLKVGLWFEATYSVRSKNIGLLKNQMYFASGTDYTFGLGNGLYFIFEHLIAIADSTAFDFQETANFSATSLTYPLSFFDNLTAISYYNYSAKSFTYFVNYEHQFKTFSAYLMAFHNPSNQQLDLQNNLNRSFMGYGFQFLLVYNH